MKESHTDAIKIETYVVSIVIIFILLLACRALYIEPDQTAQNFAWTVKPRTSAILIGAGYTAGAYFFIRLLTEKKWHRVQAGFLPITVFTLFMLVATLLHRDRFHQGTFLFYVWIVVYVLTPILVPFLWWRNRPTSSQNLEERDLRFSLSVRRALGLVGAAGALFALLVFIQPTLLISLTPWKLTDLMARIFSGWIMLTALTILSLAYDGRWSAARILVQSAIVGLALTLLALPRIWHDLNQTHFMTYLFVIGLVLALAALMIVHLWMNISTQRSSTA